MKNGPSLGGFVCPFVVIAADRWMIGQLTPGDRLRFVPVTIDDAAAADELFSILMGDDVVARRSFITQNARDVRFLDV